MKQFIQTICVMLLLAGLVFSGNRRIAKSEIRMERMRKVEPDYRNGPGATRPDACAHTYPNNDNAVVTVIDSSANGFGMVATVTRPMDVNSDGNMLVVYRQYAGENTTHGQLGAGYGEEQSDGSIDWTRQLNINANGDPPWGGGGVGGAGTAQARYPSAIASEDYPYAVWNEYTGNVAGWPSNCSSYGGRPYFSYDEFGWFGNSWFYPQELDPLYDCGKDLWQGSVGYAYGDGEHHVSVVYDDWTRTGSYLFTSEAVEDGYIILGTETLIVNPQHLGTDGYSSSAILSMNDAGKGLLGIDGIFAGAEPDAAPCAQECGSPATGLTCNKIPMFKLTDDYGETWMRTTGNAPSYDYYYVGNEVFDNIFGTWPSQDVDACSGQISEFCGYWSWYEFDMRVDNIGNPHIVISLIAESQDYFHFLEGYTGFYHLTIEAYDANGNWTGNLDDPDPVNSPGGWNWSYIPLPANDSFAEYRPDGSTYLFGAMCQISLSRDNPDIVYMVANIAEQGDMAAEYDADGDNNEDDPCLAWDFPHEVYPTWSEDIWVAKSLDNGATWTGLENVTKTPRDPSNTGFNNCSPEEQYVHTAHWSDNDRVYFQYNQPNWNFNEIGDLTGADYMNRVFLGYSWVEAGGMGGCTDPTSCNYSDAATFDDGTCANLTLGTGVCEGNGDGPVGTFGCDCAGNCYTYIDQPLQVVDCADICGGTSVQLCAAVGGLGDCVDTDTNGDGVVDSSDNPTVCTYSTVPECINDPNYQSNCSVCNSFDDVNSWDSCGGAGLGEFCGVNHPAVAGCGSASPFYTNNCTGGRCYTCSDPISPDDENCSLFNPNDGHPINDCTAICNASAGEWDVLTVADCDDAVYPCSDQVTDRGGCDAVNGWFEPYISDFNNDEIEGNQGDVGNPDECYCLASDSEDQGGCEVKCPQVGDLSGDGNFNVLDIVIMANCILSGNCVDHENGCAGDVNDDGTYNVLDIVQLANCVLASNCGGRVNDASESRLIMQGNVVSIEADGFIGGVQMTITHGDDFSIEMTDYALLADYLTNGNETRILIVNPEREELFSHSGDFEIAEIIVANTQYEISVDLAIASEFSLSDAYPNPFNPTTTMTLTLPVSGEMKVEIYNLLGQVVTTLASGYMDANTYKLTWDASDAASGVYFVKAQTDGFTSTQKLMLVK